MEFTEFAQKYCETQDSTLVRLRTTLLAQQIKFNPTGWLLGECQVLDSSSIGERTILPYGPNNTIKELVTYYSPRGLASDTAIVIGTLSAEDFLKYIDSLPELKG